MITIGQILKKKGSDIWTVRMDASVHEVLVLLAEKNVGALPVLDADAKPMGIVSERDYARKVALPEKPKNTPVRDIMTPLSEMHCVTGDATAEECMMLITAKNIRHLPVIDDHRFIGIVSIRDLVKTVIDDKEQAIEQLHNYISGKYV